MTVQYHDPRAAPLAAPEPYALRTDLSRAARIGMLANGFPDSAVFLEAVAVALAARLPDARFTHYRKANASVPASADLLDRIAAECGAAVAAYGH